MSFQTRLWVTSSMNSEEDGDCGIHFSIENPAHIPRVGDFVENAISGGFVYSVRRCYFIHEYESVIYCFVREKKPDGFSQ